MYFLIWTFPGVVDVWTLRWRYLKASPELPQYIVNIFRAIVLVLETISRQEIHIYIPHKIWVNSKKNRFFMKFFNLYMDIFFMKLTFPDFPNVTSGRWMHCKSSLKYFQWIWILVGTIFEYLKIIRSQESHIHISDETIPEAIRNNENTKEAF